MQSLRIVPFSTPYRFAILPGLDLQLGKCDNPDCHHTHGIALELQWAAWGIALEIVF